MSLEILDKDEVIEDNSQDKILSLFDKFDRDDQKKQILDEYEEILESEYRSIMREIKSRYKRFIKSYINKFLREKRIYGYDFDNKEKVRMLKEIDQNELVCKCIDKIVQIDGEVLKEGKAEKEGYVSEDFKEEWKHIIENIVKKEIDQKLQWYSQEPLSWQWRNEPENLDAMDIGYIRSDADKILKALGPRRINKIKTMTFSNYKKAIIDTILYLNRFSYTVLVKYDGINDISAEKVERENNV